MSNELDTQEIVRLYVEEEWSVREIASRHGCAYSKIYGILRSRVVMRGTKGPGRRRDDMRHLKVADTMRERIVTGDWPPNRKILSQEDLAKIFDVGLQTIREAVAHLRQHGYLTTVRNKGTYARPPQDWESAT